MVGSDLPDALDHVNDAVVAGFREVIADLSRGLVIALLERRIAKSYAVILFGFECLDLGVRRDQGTLQPLDLAAEAR